MPDRKRVFTNIPSPLVLGDSAQKSSKPMSHPGSVQNEQYLLQTVHHNVPKPYPEANHSTKPQSGVIQSNRTQSKVVNADSLKAFYQQQLDKKSSPGRPGERHMCGLFSTMCIEIYQYYLIS